MQSRVQTGHAGAQHSTTQERTQQHGMALHCTAHSTLAAAKWPTHPIRPQKTNDLKPYCDTRYQGSSAIQKKRKVRRCAMYANAAQFGGKDKARV